MIPSCFRLKPYSNCNNKSRVYNKLNNQQNQGLNQVKIIEWLNIFKLINWILIIVAVANPGSSGAASMLSSIIINIIYLIQL